jgi:L-threonylcarbamoyladenylate synthase
MIEKEVNKAGNILRSGGIILYPTDTIWGIGCDAGRHDSIKHIYQIKKRADYKSMLVLVDGITMLENYINSIPGQALEILENASKPTTIIYPGACNLAKNLLAPDGSIGIRITSDPFCRKLIQFTGFPIVSTSANISGEPSPGTFDQIKASIREQVDYVVNWRQNETVPSIPSSIIKIEKDGAITLIRP